MTAKVVWAPPGMQEAAQQILDSTGESMTRRVIDLGKLAETEVIDLFCHLRELDKEWCKSHQDPYFLRDIAGASQKVVAELKSRGYPFGEIIEAMGKRPVQRRPWSYDQQLVNLAFEVLRVDPSQTGEAISTLRMIAGSYLAGLFPNAPGNQPEVE